MAEDNQTTIEDLKARIALQETEIGLLQEKKDFLADEESVQASKLELAKLRLEELRKEIVAKGELANLSESERKSLELRISFLQQTVRLENQRLQHIKESQQASENLSDIAGKYFSQITMINDGWRETALGGLLQASMTADGLEGAFKRMGEAIKNLPMNVFANIMGEIEQQTVKMFSSISASRAELTAMTGLTDQNFGSQVQDLARDFGHLGLGVSDAHRAVADLYVGFSNFRNLDAETRDSLKKTVMTLKALGVDGPTAIKFMEESMKMFGESAEEAQASAMKFVAVARRLKQTSDELIESFSRFSGELAAFRDAKGVFLSLAESADKAGSSVEEMMKVTRRFDNFKSAARAVQELNAALGGNVLAFHEMTMLKPEERFEKIRQALLGSGKDFENMGHHQKAFIARAAGFTDVGEMMKFLQEQTGQAEEKANKYGLTQEQISKIAKNSKTAFQHMEVALQQLAIAIEPVVIFFVDLASAVAGFLSGPGGEIVMWIVAITVGLVVLTKFITMVSGAFTALRTIGGATAAAGALSHAAANKTLAASYATVATAATTAAGPMAAVTKLSLPFLGIIALIVGAITVLAVVIADFAKEAIKSGVSIWSLVAAMGALGLMMAGFGAIAPIVLLGAIAMTAAFIALGIGLAFVSTKDLQAIATIFSSITAETSKDPFGAWIVGIGAFASKAEDVVDEIEKIGLAFATISAQGSKIQPITALFTSVANIDETSVQGIAETKALVQELRVAVDNQSVEALKNVLSAFKTSTTTTEGREGDIVIELDGREVGRFINKEMKQNLKANVFRT